MASACDIFTPNGNLEKLPFCNTIPGRDLYLPKVGLFHKVNILKRRLSRLCDETPVLGGLATQVSTANFAAKLQLGGSGANGILAE